MGMAAAAAVEPKFHILAVDDNLIDRKLIERLLKKSSCQVTTVDSGSKALEFLGFQKEEDEYEQGSSCNINYPSVSPNSTSSHPKLVSLSPGKKDAEVNLIITDYCMPGMTGYDLLKKIKESSTFRDIPVVIMSSENVPSRINRCLEEGAKEFFLKPVGLSDVNKLKSHMLKAKSGDYFSEQEKHEEGLPRKQPPELQLLEQQSQKQLQERESDQRTQETASQTHEMHVLIHASQQQLQQQQPLPPTSTNNSKRASSSSSSMDEELSPDNRKRPRYSGLSVA